MFCCITLSHILWYHIISYLRTSYLITSYHITSHHITPHHNTRTSEDDENVENRELLEGEVEKEEIWPPLEGRYDPLGKHVRAWTWLYMHVFSWYLLIVVVLLFDRKNTVWFFSIFLSALYMACGIIWSAIKMWSWCVTSHYVTWYSIAYHNMT